jgi:hypothetical protein
VCYPLADAHPSPAARDFSRVWRRISLKVKSAFCFSHYSVFFARFSEHLIKSLKAVFAFKHYTRRPPWRASHQEFESELCVQTLLQLKLMYSKGEGSIMTQSRLVITS